MYLCKGLRNYVSTDTTALSDTNVTIIGNDNRLIIPEDLHGSLTIDISGHGHTIRIEDNLAITKSLTISVSGNENSITIGEGTSVIELTILLHEYKNNVAIGRDCMFSRGNEIIGTDFHSLVDRDTGKITNHHISGITIGNHVWVGLNAIILKDTTIGEGSVISAGSLVARHVPAYTMVGGVPAKVIKENVSWERMAPRTVAGFTFQEGNCLGEVSGSNIEFHLECNLEAFISGWAMIPDVKIDSFATKLYLEYLDSAGKKCLVQARNEIRVDVANAYNCENYINSGFYVVFDYPPQKILHLIAVNKGVVHSVAL